MKKKLIFLFFIFLTPLFSLTQSCITTTPKGYIKTCYEVIGEPPWLYQFQLEKGIPITIKFHTDLTEKYFQDLSDRFCDDEPNWDINYNLNITCSNGFHEVYTGSSKIKPFDMIVHEDNITCNVEERVNITTLLKKDGGGCEEKHFVELKNYNFSFMRNVDILNKQPAADWNFRADWQNNCRRQGNFVSCIINVGIDRKRQILFQTNPGQSPSFKVECEVSGTYQGFNIPSSDSGQCAITHGNDIVEKGEVTGISCTLSDAYGSMKLCPYSLKERSGGIYEILLGPCQPQWFITIASDDDYFDIKCDGTAKVTAYDYLGNKIAEQNYPFSLNEARFNVTGILDAKPLAQLIEEAITNLTNSLSMASLFYTQAFAYQETAAQLLIAFGGLAEISFDCPPLKVPAKKGNKVNSALENILFFSKITWCQIANSALNAIKTYFLVELMKQLDKNKVKVKINDKIVEYDTLSRWIKSNIEKLIFSINSQATLCTYGTFKLLEDKSIEDIHNEEKNSVFLKIFRAICGPYYDVVKDYLVFKKSCDDKVNEIWTNDCERKLEPLSKNEKIINYFKEVCKNPSEDCKSLCDDIKKENKLNITNVCDDKTITIKIRRLSSCIKSTLDLDKLKVYIKENPNGYLNCLKRNNLESCSLISCGFEAWRDWKDKLFSKISSTVKLPKKIICDIKNNKISCTCQGNNQVKIRKDRITASGNEIIVMTEPFKLKIDSSKIYNKKEKLLKTEEGRRAICSAIDKRKIKIGGIPIIHWFGSTLEISCVPNNNVIIVYLRNPKKDIEIHTVFDANSIKVENDKVILKLKNLDERIKVCDIINNKESLSILGIKDIPNDLTYSCTEDNNKVTIKLNNLNNNTKICGCDCNSQNSNCKCKYCENCQKTINNGECSVILTFNKRDLLTNELRELNDFINRLKGEGEIEIEVDNEIKNALKEAILNKGDSVSFDNCNEINKLGKDLKDMIKDTIVTAIFQDNWFGGDGKVEKTINPVKVPLRIENCRGKCEDILKNKEVEILDIDKILTKDKISLKVSWNINNNKINEFCGNLSNFKNYFNTLGGLRVGLEKEVKSLSGYNSEKKEELCSLANNRLESIAYVLSAIWNIAMKDLGKRITLLGYAIKSLSECYAGDYWFNMFFFYIGPHYAQIMNAYCGFSAVKTVKTSFENLGNEEKPLLERILPLLSGPIGVMCAWMNINSYCTSQTYDILAVSNWNNLFPKSFMIIPFAKSDLPNTNRIAAVIALKAERPVAYSGGDWINSGQIFGMPYKTGVLGTGLLSGLTSMIAQSMETVMIPCADAIGKRLLDLNRLFNKNKDCLVAYIAPNYFQGMRTQSTIQRLEDELQRLKPALDSINDQEINNNVQSLNNVLNQLNELSHQLALQDMGLFTLPPINPQNQTTLEKFWRYYQLWKKMNDFKKELERLKLEIQMRPNIDNNLKSQMINKINEALNLVNQIINKIPKPLRDYFKEREVELSQPFQNIDLIYDIINKPDKFAGIKECFNLTKEIACTQNLMRSLCYMAAFGGMIEGFIEKPVTKNNDFVEFLNDWNKRLGATSINGPGSYEDVINRLRPIFEFCGKSIDDIRRVYRKMKETEERISQSIADQVAGSEGCKAGFEVTVDEGKTGIQVSCQGGYIIVRETIAGRICTIDKDIGLEVTGYQIHGPNSKGEGENKITVDANVYGRFVYIGKSDKSAKKFRINLIYKINKNRCNSDIVTCVINEYVTKVSWQFVELEEEIVGNKVEYNIVGPVNCGNGFCSSEALIRESPRYIKVSDSCNNSGSNNHNNNNSNNNNNSQNSSNNNSSNLHNNGQPGSRKK